MAFADSNMQFFLPLKFCLILKLKKLGWSYNPRACHRTKWFMCMYGKDTFFLLQDKTVGHLSGQDMHEQCLLIFYHFLTLGFYLQQIFFTLLSPPVQDLNTYHHCHGVCIDQLNKLAFMYNPVLKSILSAIPLVGDFGEDLLAAFSRFDACFLKG